MDIEKAIFNWLQIAVVYEARPDDPAAKETEEFFREILTKDHQIEKITYERGPFNYIVTFEKEGREEKKPFASSTIEKLIEDIENEPRFRI